MFGALQGSQGHGIYRSGNGQEKQKFFKVHVIEHRGIVLALIKKIVGEKSRSFFCGDHDGACLDIYRD